MVLKIELREWDKKQIPSDLREDEVFLSSLHNLAKHKIVDILLEGREIYIKARNYVGIFSLPKSEGERVILLIEPKIPIKSLVKMISNSEKLDIKEANELEVIISPAGESVSDLLIVKVISRFIECLRDAIVWGFHQTRSTSIEVSSVVRGRLLLSETATLIFHKSTPQAVYEIVKWDINTPVNSVIKLACERLIKSKLLHLLNNPRSSINILSQALLELNSVSDYCDDYMSIEELKNFIPLDRTYLYELLHLAVIINKYLQSEEIYISDIINIPSMYINMDDLFEKYVRVLFQRAAQLITEKYKFKIHVRKAGKEENYFISEPKESVWLVPDIIIQKKVNSEYATAAVCDVKYRVVTNPLSEDRESIYQIYAYMSGWNVNYGILIYPVFDETIQKVQKYMFKDGKQLIILYIDANVNVDEVRTIANLMENLIKT